ncbi:hypothetical protein WA026_020023 [Henosepilachna vigintioctopunctata]|uniref:Uncharacterized protein n=1 Tax=Henosepilachna vigintioctopunctata TaxID=420089 RepID=A0AAW1UUA1_9CUCU
MHHVPTNDPKVFAQLGRKQAARVTSAERGDTTTAVICTSASETFVPPILIFRRVRKKLALMDDTPIAEDPALFLLDAETTEMHAYNGTTEPPISDRKIFLHQQKILQRLNFLKDYHPALAVGLPSTSFGVVTPREVLPIIQIVGEKE